MVRGGKKEPALTASLAQPASAETELHTHTQHIRARQAKIASNFTSAVPSQLVSDEEDRSEVGSVWGDKAKGIVEELETEIAGRKDSSVPQKKTP
jgi:hypothetical protein